MSEQGKEKSAVFTEEADRLRSDLVNGGFGPVELSSIDSDSSADASIIDRFVSMFGSKDDTPLKAYDWVAHIPSHLCSNSKFRGPLYGVIREETESIYVFDSKYYKDDKYVIGYIDNCPDPSMHAFRKIDVQREKYVVGFFQFEKLALQLISSPSNSIHNSNSFGSTTINVRIQPYDMATKLFSRNTGLLESSIMLDKCAVLVGCGSVGSFAALELARAGVGKFVLCDTDILEIHNICRHQCGFDDLGRYKVEAVRDKIRNINPNAEIITFRSVIQRVPEEELLPHLGRKTIIIGGGDNRASADWACKLAIRTDSAFVSTCCWTRAFAGEIFYWASGKSLSCYSCALGGLIDGERPDSHATYFGSEEEKSTLSFEPGVAVDIDFVTIIAVKLALDLLNRDNPNYTPRVINYLRQYTWVCNTNETRIGGERAAMFPHPLFVTNNLSVHRDANCSWCGDGSSHDKCSH